MSEPQDELPESARGGIFRIDLKRDGPHLWLSLRRRPQYGEMAAILWLILWLSGCLAMTRKFIGEPRLLEFVLAISFWTVWLAVFYQLLKAFTLREVLILEPQGATFVRQVLVPIHRRMVPFDKISGFHTCEMYHPFKKRLVVGTEMRTSGEPLQFGFGLDLAVHTWLQDKLNDHLSQLRLTDTAQIPTPSDSDFYDGHP